MNPVDKRRREFLGQATAIAGAMIAPGVFLYDYAQAGSPTGASRPRAPGEPVSGKVRWGLLIDKTKCESGCQDCVDACIL